MLKANVVLMNYIEIPGVIVENDKKGNISGAKHT